MGIITIKKRSDFQKVYTRGRKRVGSSIVLYRLPSEDNGSRFGFVASKKTGNAVVRNRLRRLFKEICRLHPDAFPPGYDYVVIARASAALQDYRTLSDQLLKLARSL